MRVFAGHKWKDADNWGFWFRILGYGIAASTLTPMFSERYGYTKVLRIGKVKIKLLRPDHPSQGIKQ